MKLKATRQFFLWHLKSSCKNSLAVKLKATRNLPYFSTCRLILTRRSPQPQGSCLHALWHEARAHGLKHLGGLSHKARARHALWHEARAHGLKHLGGLSHKARARHALWHEARAHGLRHLGGLSHKARACTPFGMRHERVG